MSDADALWLNDPTHDLFHTRISASEGDRSSSGGNHGGRDVSVVGVSGGDGDGRGRRARAAGVGTSGSIRDSDVVASRGSYPRDLGGVWGSTMCMGFILFRAKNVAGMASLLGIMEDLVMKNGDDQVPSWLQPCDGKRTSERTHTPTCL